MMRPGGDGGGIQRGGDGRGRDSRGGDARGDGRGRDGRGPDARGDGRGRGEDGRGRGRGDGQFRPGEGAWADHRPNRIPDRAQWEQWRKNHSDAVRDEWRAHWNEHNHWCGNEWWANYPHAHYHFHGGMNWWAWAAWPALTAWFPWNWTQPVYYNYGYPDSVYYVDNTVYYGNQPVAAAEEYAFQAERIATSIPPDVTPADSDWMPLGVFALTNDGQDTGAEPTIFLQLAVSKQGIIAGTFQNTTTGTVKSIEGMVDRESQRAAWTEVGKTRPLMETGLSNLTQDNSPALVHFADGSTQQFLLVRLNKPTGQ
jgi:hypothetical protein